MSGTPGTRGVSETHIKKVWRIGFHDPLEQRRRAIVAVSSELGIVEEREFDVITRRPDDHIHLFARAISENYAIAVQPLDPRFHRDVT